MKKQLIISLSVLTITACSGPKFDDAQYWQRADTTSSLYMQGPKAQQTLHQNIAACTADINELKRLGSLRKAIPADDPDDHLNEWDTPERDGFKFADHLDYTDFETCMHHHGWQRVEHLPFDVADKARDDWVDTIIGSGDGDKIRKKETFEQKRRKDPFNTLNN